MYTTFFGARRTGLGEQELRDDEKEYGKSSYSSPMNNLIATLETHLAIASIIVIFIIHHPDNFRQQRSLFVDANKEENNILFAVRITLKSGW